jgi:hypothetical protein
MIFEQLASGRLGTSREIYHATTNGLIASLLDTGTSLSQI